MKIHLSHLVSILSLSGIIAAPVFADTTNQVTYKKHAHAKPLQNQSAASTVPSLDTPGEQVQHEKFPLPQQGPVSQQMSGKDIIRLISESQEYLPFDLDVPGQAFVSTGPYIGVPIQFAGGNLIINSPSVNTDLILLGIRKSITEQLNALAGEYLKEPYHSHLLFSGVVEGQAQYFNFSGPNNGGAPSTNIDVTNVTVDMTVFGPSDWILGFIEMTYDSSPPYLTGVFESTSHFTVANSRLLINKAFVTIGNLHCSPFYGTFGQFYVPYGVYSSVYVSDPLTKLLGRTKARAIEVGFSQQSDKAFYGSAFIFRGDSRASEIDKINNGGLNLGFNYNVNNIALNVGGSVIANLADSVGMQIGTGFQSNEQLSHRVVGYNARFNLGLGSHWDFIGEFIAAATRFNPNDMSYKAHGAKPSAFDIEGSYSFKVGDWPTAIGAGYEHTYQALALGLPMNRYELVFNTSILRNTLQSLEIRHDHEYAASITATGAGVRASSQTGRGDTAVIAQFDFYF